mmetsp:Transcript_74385/g.205292  ORF Transcript_74385/g.205292 Transcript_74385/m.205292 type:complete len:213 (+) Transcript_74385:63-701(+)
MRLFSPLARRLRSLSTWEMPCCAVRGTSHAQALHDAPLFWGSWPRAAERKLCGARGEGPKVVARLLLRRPEGEEDRTDRFMPVTGQTPSRCDLWVRPAPRGDEPALAPQLLQAAVIRRAAAETAPQQLLHAKLDPPRFTMFELPLCADPNSKECLARVRSATEFLNSRVAEPEVLPQVARCGQQLLALRCGKHRQPLGVEVRRPMHRLGLLN